MLPFSVNSCDCPGTNKYSPVRRHRLFRLLLAGLLLGSALQNRIEEADCCQFRRLLTKIARCAVGHDGEFQNGGEDER